VTSEELRATAISAKRIIARSFTTPPDYLPELLTARGRMWPDRSRRARAG
jgi:hypothetical protein